MHDRKDPVVLRMRSENMHAFWLSYTVVLRQKVNLANNHLTFHDNMDVIFKKIIYISNEKYYSALYRVAQNKIHHQRICNISATSSLILKILEAA